MIMEMKIIIRIIKENSNINSHNNKDASDIPISYTIDVGESTDKDNGSE